MARVPFNPKIGRIKTDAGNFAVDRSFLAHYNFAPDAESDTAVMAATALGAEASSVAAGFANPDVPRNVKIKASAAQVTGATYKVKVYGTNFAGDAITEEINPGGTSASAGNLAFKTVTKVDLPQERTLRPSRKLPLLSHREHRMRELQYSHLYLRRPAKLSTSALHLPRTTTQPRKRRRKSFPL